MTAQHTPLWERTFGRDGFSVEIDPAKEYCPYVQFNWLCFMSSVLLQQLLARRDTWRGCDPDACRRVGRSTGFNDLDRLLNGGWPEHGLVEWLCPLPCPPLLHLLLPVLAGDEPGARIIANPPARPSAPALAAAGVPLEHLLILQSGNRAGLLHACFEAVASDALSVLALWAPGGALPTGTLRRLHLGAQQGRCLLILARPLRAARQPSPAPLRLVLGCPSPGELAITVHKQPGDRPGGRCRLTLLPEHLRRAPPACVTLPTLTRRPAAALPPPAPLMTPRAEPPVPLLHQ